MRTTTTRWSAALALRSPPRLSLWRLVLPLEAGIGQAPQSLAKAASERMRPGVVADEDEHLGGGAGLDAVRRDRRRGALRRQPIEVRVVAPDLGVEIEPAPGDGAQARLGRGRGGGERTRAQRGQVADQRHL